MIKGLQEWCEERVGYRGIIRAALYEHIPGGSRWRYVWGSTLTFVLFVQFVTGIFLWMAYSPSAQTAWESVYYIQYQMSGGWLLRGLHHWMASLMTVLLVLHLMQVVIDGAYKAPREVNFWFGVLLLMLVLALSLTGYLLPWDQKGFWATKVATNILVIVPAIGPALQKLVIGGADYGHHTLTRFFALHAGVLPAAIVVLLTWHIYLFRRHGITVREPKRRPDAYFWPDQVLKDAVACLAVLAAVLFLIVRPWLFGGGELGAELGAPADPAETYSAARPEWYFLFLFEFLKWFPGGKEIWGAIIIPGIVMAFIFLMPLLGRWRLGHGFNLGLLYVLLLGIGALTYMARSADTKNPAYVAAVRDAEHDAARVKALAQAQGIPAEGAASLLRGDSFTQGPKLFARNCASCHRYEGHDGTHHVPKEAATSSDLKNFASRPWLEGLLDPTRIDSMHYFGGTKFKDGRMAKFVKRDVSKFTPEQKENLRKVVAAVSADAGLQSQREIDRAETTVIEQGKALFDAEDMRCAECHAFHKANDDATGPDLTGYGSREWLTAFLKNPAHERFYGKRNDRMPKFGEDKILSAEAIRLLVDWLRGEWYEPTGNVTVK